MIRSLTRLLLCGTLASAPLTADADEIRVAVASNFLPTARILAREFETRTGHTLRLSAASTGTLYAQIRQGAPYDVFLAADRRRPRLLEEQGLTAPGSRFTYARGRLVLWSADPTRLHARGQTLRGKRLRRLAIANPRTAPYGAAARTVLRRLDLWDHYQERLVRGQNVAQTLQFVTAGGVDAGFVALAQVRALPREKRGSLWLVPAELYPPIDQQAVRLRSGNRPAADAFLTFLREPAARTIIHSHGYGFSDPRTGIGPGFTGRLRGKPGPGNCQTAPILPSCGRTKP